MRFLILGPLEVWRDTTRVDLGEPKQRALLGALLLHPDQAVPWHRLVEYLWGDAPPRSAANNLQVHVCRLRQALADPDRAEQALVTQPGGYRLRLKPEQLDASQFQQQVARARQAGAAGDLEGAASGFRAALGLWRGSPLEDAGLSAATEIMRLEEERLLVLLERVDAELALGRHDRLVPELQALATAYPFRERLHAQLMLALYRSGRQSEALEAFHRVRQVLRNELGVEPGPELHALQGAILRSDPCLEPATRPLTVGARQTVVPALPPQLTSFIGREQELARISRLLAQHRLVTLAGPGGCGKTRLALQVVGQDASLLGFGARVWLVDLAAFPDQAPVARTIGMALGLDPAVSAEPRAPALVECLRAGRALLIVDNCEHLVAACARVVEPLLQRCPGLVVLATSREPLGAAGEIVFRVPPLALPAPGLSDLDHLAANEAVRLFVDRAQAVDLRFKLDQETAAAMARVCRRLDGLPLAIELAAARTWVLPVRELVARLDDQLGLLAGGRRTAHPRQRTLRASIDWSWRLLEERERRLLARLSVFADTFTLPTAQAHCAGPDLSANDVLDLVSRLAERSLLLVDTGDEAVRFRLPESLRQYAAERLAEYGAAHQA